MKKFHSALYILLSSQGYAMYHTIQSYFLRRCSPCDQGLLQERVALRRSQAAPFIFTWHYSVPHRNIFLGLLV